VRLPDQRVIQPWSSKSSSARDCRKVLEPMLPPRRWWRIRDRSVAFDLRVLRRDADIEQFELLGGMCWTLQATYDSWRHPPGVDAGTLGDATVVRFALSLGNRGDVLAESVHNLVGVKPAGSSRYCHPPSRERRKGPTTRRAGKWRSPLSADSRPSTRRERRRRMSLARPAADFPCGNETTVEVLDGGRLRSGVTGSSSGSSTVPRRTGRPTRH
jgi:hypothetical protein